MSIKSILAKILSKYVKKQIKNWSENPHETQEKVFKSLMSSAKNTQFGRDHHFSKIKSYEDYKKNVPVRDYEGLRPYVNEILSGKKDVLWKGAPTYLAKTSGTTSGEKYIPISKESMPNHIKAARNALFCYIAETGKTDFLNAKMIFLQGSPVLEKKNGLNFGRLSGIAAHFVPSYLQKNRTPTWETNCIEDWETKVDAIVEETVGQDMRLISGIPPWIQMYFKKIIEKTGQSISEVFPKFELFVTGGVNYEPYRDKMNELVGKQVDIIQTYPASEGFIAYQNSQQSEDLLLLLNHGIFYEFIPSTEFFNENPNRISLKEVEIGIDYVLILNTNAGLWAYNIGDTVRFTSKTPYKILVTGRIKHFTSAFGEHVIANEVEEALKETIETHHCQITEFSVAPQVNPTEGLPHHEWYIEFEKEPQNLTSFTALLDKNLRKRNTYYDDLIIGNVLTSLKIKRVKSGGFIEYMKAEGRLGGQNKVPRLLNDDKLVSKLELV